MMNKIKNQIAVQQVFSHPLAAAIIAHLAIITDFSLNMTQHFVVNLRCKMSANRQDYYNSATVYIEAPESGTSELCSILSLNTHAATLLLQ